MTGVRVTTTEVVVVQTAPADGMLSEAYAAQTAAYLASADRMIVVADLALKVCVVLFILILAGWAIGLLPGAIRLF